jgi:uncharacterized membrane protein
MTLELFRKVQIVFWLVLPVLLIASSFSRFIDESLDNNFFKVLVSAMLATGICTSGILIVRKEYKKSVALFLQITLTCLGTIFVMLSLAYN